MKKRTIPFKLIAKALMIMPLLGVVGKLYAYDFSAVCETGQSLYYNIIDASNHHVELTYPGSFVGNPWDEFEQPEGSIILPENVYYDGVQYTVISIGDYAFFGCGGLTGNLTIPNTVISIGDYAFQYCWFTGNLTIGNSVISLGQHAFLNCLGFTSLYIGNSVTTIGQNAFSGCFNLETISVGIGNISYDSRDNCNALINTNTNELILGCKNSFIPDSVTTIGNSAFSGCSGLSGELIIPNSVTVIGNSAFYGCTSLTGELIIPNSVTTIGDYAFYNCSGFTGGLTIPNSVTTIGSFAFFNCSGFTGNLIISNSITSINNCTFRGCGGFTGNLTIPISVTSIGDYAFHSCSGFTGDLTIPNSVTSMGNGVFVGCSGFTGNLTISNSLTEIGNAVFSNCSGFTGSLTIPNTVTKIGESAFSGCNGFTGSLAIGNSMTEIGNFTFYRCSGFTGNLTIPNSVTSIGSSAFNNCSGFTSSLYIPNSVVSIGENAFRGTEWYNIQPNGILYLSDCCLGYKGSTPTGTLTLLEGTRVICDAAFRSCNNLIGDLTIPNTVTTIGDEAFWYCSGFTGDLIIPNSVTKIGKDAFAGCSGFSSIVSLAQTPPTLGECAFCLMGSNIPIYVPCESEETYASQFWGGFDNFIGLCGGTVSVMVNPTEGGTVIGSGIFEAGQLCILTAIANEGYVFLNWTQDGAMIASESDYSFYVASDISLAANFVSENNIDFADANVKSICVSHWDTDNDGELSYAEAALVTNLGNYFKSNTQINLFDELQYFISLSSIGVNAFQNCSGLQSIILPNSLISIGNNAFNGCSNLMSITIPNSVNKIGTSAFVGTGWYNNQPDGILYLSDCCLGYKGGKPTNSLDLVPGTRIISDNAFQGCSGITSLTIPNSVTSIGSRAFYNCRGFTEVHFNATNCQDNSSNSNSFLFCHGDTLYIGDNVTRIPANMFYGSEFSGDLIIPDAVTSIGKGAFQQSGFTGNLVIGNSVTIIEDYAFYGCEFFSGNLILGSSITKIGTFAFHSCRFTGSLVIPNSVIRISNGAFIGCNGFTGSLCIGESVVMIEDCAFMECSGFDGELTIPSSVVTIGISAFSGCSGLTGKLIIPSSVTSIGGEAFLSCYGITEMMVFRTIPPVLGYSDIVNTDFPIYVPYESLNNYKTTANWNHYENRIYPMVYKTITGYGENNNLWQFIASPLVEITSPETVDNMMSETDYDLYQFNPTETDGQWQNHKANNFDLVNGQGYLYASEEEVNIIFKGEFNEDETKVVELVYDEGSPNAGWNLVGNPFPVSAYINRDYYIMNEDGTGINPVAVPASTPIPPCTGVMVRANGAGETVVFCKTAP